MNSMFSSFDVLCGEFLGQTIRSPFASATTPHHNLIGKPKAASPSPSPEGVAKQQQPPKKAQRFAPELDGLNCFETLVNF
ncbi:conserved hypothetical protein [Ricinus communis]|uniref:Uncharacterized protein n=1 Tax=Ricinus communis TaxID=3988 RepID=B9RYW4_RICCO|nr:conserved hypothetical protein [Ricinus communis]